MNYLESTPYIHGLRPARNLGRVYTQNFGFLFSGSLLPKISYSLSSGYSFSELCPLRVLTSKIIWDTFFVVYRFSHKAGWKLFSGKMQDITWNYIFSPRVISSLTEFSSWDIEFLIKKLLHLILSPFHSFIHPFIWLTLCIRHYVECCHAIKKEA